MLEFSPQTLRMRSLEIKAVQWSSRKEVTGWTLLQQDTIEGTIGREKVQPGRRGTSSEETRQSLSLTAQQGPGLPTQRSSSQDPSNVREEMLQPPRVWYSPMQSPRAAHTCAASSSERTVVSTWVEKGTPKKKVRHGPKACLPVLPPSFLSGVSDSRQGLKPPAERQDTVHGQETQRTAQSQGFPAVGCRNGWHASVVRADHNCASPGTWLIGPLGKRVDVC